jgi:TolA-binding protein
MENIMKKSIILLVLILIPVSSLFAQLPESGSFEYLKKAFSKRNSDVMEYLINESNHYLLSFWDSPNADEVLFMIGMMYEDDSSYPQAFLSYLKIKFIHPNSNRRNDSVSNLNQIVHNKAEGTFSEKRKDIDELVSQTLSYNDRNTAYYDYIKFVYELNVEDLNEFLLQDIMTYTSIYADKANNVDQLYFWIGGLYKKSSDWSQSILAYDKIKYLTPESLLIPQALFQIALLQYQETGQYNEAKDTFVSLISAYPDLSVSGDAQFYLAELYENKLENPDEAVTNYRVLVESYPDSRFAVESLKRVAEIMEDKENYVEAIASYYQIFELYPKNAYTPEAVLEIENLYRRRLENYEKAIETLKLYADQFPQREDAAERLFDAGDIYSDDLNNKQAAIDTYNEVINKFPASDFAEKAKDRIQDLSEE